MKQKQSINLKPRIVSWLFFLFLSSGISYYNDLQFGKPVQIERVDQIISKSGKKISIAKFSISSKKGNSFRKLNSQFLHINLLSRKLDNIIIITLNRQSSLFRLLFQNTILHFRSRNLASNSSDDFPDFIS